MEHKELTEEQKKKLSKLQTKFMLKTGVVGIKAGAIIFAANAVVIAIDLLYAHSQPFVVFMTVVNFLMIFRHMRAELIELEDEAREECKKILEDKNLS